jgi:hypothetical protein
MQINWTYIVYNIYNYSMQLSIPDNTLSDTSSLCMMGQSKPLIML